MRYTALSGIFLSLFLVSGCIDPMQGIHKQVINDSISQYNIVLSGGDPIEICVHAGLVVAAYTQAKDQEGYSKWKTIERSRCAAAGL